MTRVLILRADDDAQRTAARLRALGHDAIATPIVSQVATGMRPSAESARALIATSGKAIRSLSAADVALLAGLPLFVVGSASAATAAAIGFRQVIEGGGTAETLLDIIRDTVARPGPLLYLAGEPRRPLLEDRLAAAGFDVQACLLYRMQPAQSLPEATQEAFRQGAITTILHYSAASAVLFARLTQQAGLVSEASRPVHLCLSAEVRSGLAALPDIVTRIAATPDETALFEQI